MPGFQLSGVYLPSLIFSLMRTSMYGPPFSELVNVEPEYDYVIVGSGWGGSVLANRLSQDTSTKVLLLEAGAKENVSTEIPLLSMSQHGDGYDWKYLTTPQKNMCLGNPDKKCPLAAGKVVGGTSTIGELIYTRANKEDMDKFGKDFPGWTYDEVLPFYKKWEDYHNQKNECVEDDEHHCGGEVYIGPVPPGTKGETAEYFIDGAKELLGLKEMRTIANEEGIERGHYFMKDGIRVTAATAFLKPIAQTRKNLHISLNSFVTKILIDPATKTATGVEFEKDGKIQQVKAKKEVLLSAGVYQSPKILMLSGIGPKKQLEKFNIPVIADLPGVGENYREYVFTLIPFENGENVSKERANILSIQTFRQWKNKKGGMLATPVGLDAGASIASSLRDKDSTGPDLVLIFQSLELHSIFSFYLKRAVGMTEDLWNLFFEPEVDKDIINIQVSTKVQSTGTIQLASANPKDHPLIDPNFYGDPEEHDIKAMIEGVRLAHKFENATAFKKHNYKRLERVLPWCKHIEDRLSDEFYKCALSYGTVSRWCPCCSNKMGSKSDPMAVLDERLRVHGISKLRVVDGSALPTYFRVPPAANIIMMGEKAAHMIKEDNKS